jgi:hypothetical protein
MLPEKLSDLLEVAINDAQTAARRKDVRFHMGTWLYRDGEICQMCLAGAVMARTLGAGYHACSSPTAVGYFAGGSKLFAIDEMRRGNFSYASKMVTGKYVDHSRVSAIWSEELLHMPPKGQRHSWWLSWRKIIRLLREEEQCVST